MSFPTPNPQDHIHTGERYPQKEKKNVAYASGLELFCELKLPGSLLFSKISRILRPRLWNSIVLG